VARNIGIVRATGTHVAFLDCDDIWRADKLDKQVRFLRDNPQYGGVHAGMKAVYFSGLERVDHKSEVRFEDLVRFPCPIFPSALVLRREALFESGLFDPTKRVCEDLDLFLRFTSQYPIGCVDEPLVIRRVQEEAASRNFGAFYHDADRVYRDYATCSRTTAPRPPRSSTSTRTSCCARSTRATPRWPGGSCAAEPAPTSPPTASSTAPCATS